MLSVVKVREYTLGSSPNATVAARWPSLLVSTHIVIVPQGTSQDQRVAVVGTMPLISTPLVYSQCSGLLQKPCEISGSGAYYRDVLHYFKAQSRINGEVFLPESLTQKSGCLIRNPTPLSMFYHVT